MVKLLVNLLFHLINLISLRVFHLSGCGQLFLGKIHRWKRADVLEYFFGCKYLSLSFSVPSCSLNNASSRWNSKQSHMVFSSWSISWSRIIANSFSSSIISSISSLLSFGSMDVQILLLQHVLYVWVLSLQTWAGVTFGAGSVLRCQNSFPFWWHREALEPRYFFLCWNSGRMFLSRWSVEGCIKIWNNGTGNHRGQMDLLHF